MDPESHLLEIETLLKPKLSTLNRNLSFDAKSFDGLKIVAGLVLAVDEETGRGVACCVSLKFPTLEMLSVETELVKIDVEYRAGFLAVREADQLVQLVMEMCRDEMQPQLLFVHGNGLLHHRRFGLANHVGTRTGLPTIGVAKNYLKLPTVSIEQPKLMFSQDEHLKRLDIVDSVDGFVYGAALRRHGQNPIYVSVGYGVDLDTAYRLTWECSPRYRIPEPLRLAEMWARKTLRE